MTRATDVQPYYNHKHGATSEASGLGVVDLQGSPFNSTPLKFCGQQGDDV